MIETTDERLDSLLRHYCGRTAQASFTVREARRKPFKKIALAAAALVLTAAIAWGAWAAVRQRPAPPAEEPYAISAEKLAALCGKGESTAQKIAGKNVGAWTPSIEYADREKVVFDVASGIFVFNYRDGRLVRTFDTDKLGVPGFQQGDAFSSLLVSEDGSRGLLTSQTADEATGALRQEYRELDLESGSVKKLENSQAFYDRYTVFQTYPVTPRERSELPGWIFGSFAAVAEGSDYLMALDFEQGAGTLASLRLIIMNAETGEIQASVSVFDRVTA